MSKYLILTILFLNLFFTPRSEAAEKSSISGESLRDVSIVVGTALGGAILGLSTLSFVEEPTDHLKNIVVGGSIGIIIGVSIVAWQQASKSQDMYMNTMRAAPPLFDTESRRLSHNKLFARNKNRSKAENPSFLFSFSY